jgi:hypothetical protein
MNFAFYNAPPIEGIIVIIFLFFKYLNKKILKILTN